MNFARVVFVVCLLPVVLWAQTPAQSVEGMVVDRVSGAAIAGVSLELTGIASDRLVSYTSTTDNQGKFLFRNVAASSGYWLVAVHESAHVMAFYGQRGLNGPASQIPVGSGQQVRDIRVSMLPTGEISGRVTNADGKPLGDAQVLAMTASFQSGSRVLHSAKSLVETNGRGEYRITGLSPGPYYIRVAARNAPNSAAPFHRTLGIDVFAGLTNPTMLFDVDGYPVAYFPGTTNQTAAQAVDLRAGGRLTGIDVSITKVSTRRLRGLVVDFATRQPMRSARLDHSLDDVYVKSIRFGDADILGNGLSVEGPLRGELEIVMATGAGAMDVRVVDSAQKPAAGLRVVLIPGEGLRGRRDRYLHRVSACLRA